MKYHFILISLLSSCTNLKSLLPEKEGPTAYRPKNATNLGFEIVRGSHDNLNEAYFRANEATPLLKVKSHTCRAMIEHCRKYSKVPLHSEVVVSSKEVPLRFPGQPLSGALQLIHTGHAQFTCLSQLKWIPQILSTRDIYEGVLLYDVKEGGGLQPGDIIVSYKGQKVENTRKLKDLIHNSKGPVANFGLKRGSKIINVDLSLVTVIDEKTNLDSETFCLN